jgi:hypothetical protein
MYSDEEDLFESVIAPGPSEPSSKRQRVDSSAFEDIARELEEDTTSAGPSRGQSEGEDDDPDAWLLQQYGAEDEGEPEGEGAWTSEEGEKDGMDLDEVEELEAELLDDGGGGGGSDQKAKGKKPVVVEEAPKEPAEEKAAYTSSGRLLVPSHKSREAKAAEGVMARVWEEMETQTVAPTQGKKKAGSKVSFGVSFPGWVELMMWLVQVEQEQVCGAQGTGVE